MVGSENVFMGCPPVSLNSAGPIKIPACLLAAPFLIIYIDAPKSTTESTGSTRLTDYGYLSGTKSAVGETGSDA